MMQNNLLIRRVLDSFHNMKCRMSIYCLDTSIRYSIVKSLVNKMIEKNDAIKVLIVVEDYETRVDIKGLFTDEILKKNIVLMTQGYINPRYNYTYNCLIYIGKYIDINIFNVLIEQNRYGLVLLTENVMNSKFINGIRAKCPDANFAIQDMRNDINHPVEGRMREVNLSTDDAEQYKQYSKYTSDTISIFGSVEMVNMARSGNSKTNTSAAEIRDTLARSNGWNEMLDTSQPYNKQIDDLFNPTALYERASNFFNVVDKRRKLVVNNVNKLDEILNIVRANSNSKILIVSKTDTFANEVTKFLIQNGVDCGDYHDDIPDRIATDSYGNPLYVRSGKNAGKMRIIKSQAISSIDEQRFNNSIIRVLSIKCASNVRLCVHCDIVIFTSTLCDPIDQFKARFRNVKVSGTPNIVYYIYCKDTIEENNIKELQSLPFLTLQYDEEKNAYFDENSNQIIL